MKIKLTVLTLALVAIIAIAATKSETQEITSPTYVIVAGMEGRDKILIYYGSQTSTVSVSVPKGEEVRLKMVDVLNDLSQKGYEVVSSSKHTTGQNFQFPVFDYTLKKTK